MTCVLASFGLGTRACCSILRLLRGNGHVCVWSIMYYSQGSRKAEQRRCQNSALQWHLERCPKRLILPHNHGSPVRHSPCHHVFSSHVVQARCDVIDVVVGYTAGRNVPGTRWRTHQTRRVKSQSCSSCGEMAKQEATIATALEKNDEEVPALGHQRLLTRNSESTGCRGIDATRLMRGRGINEACCQNPSTR